MAASVIQLPPAVRSRPPRSGRRSSAPAAEGARAGRGAHVYAIDPWDLPGNPAGKHGYDDAYGSAHRPVDDRGTAADVVRHELVSRIVAAYDAQSAKR